MPRPSLIHSPAPTIIIYFKGQATINWAAYTLLGKPTHMQQIFNVEERVIGFAATTADDPSGYPCTMVRGGMMATVSGVMRDAGLTLPPRGMRLIAQGALMDDILWFAPVTPTPCRGRRVVQE